jgi:15-cis-phytoene synthase
MMNLYHQTSYKISKLVTNKYSTSFSFATRLFRPDIREAIYSIYGFVRFADEIVDTFHEFDKEYLLKKFEEDYDDALQKGISLNPVLHSFSQTVKKYEIPDVQVRAFLQSMKTDLLKSSYTSHSEMEDYIYGSADVVGLMCLKVFCNGNQELYNKLEFPAMKLGSAFQKVNFLRDLKNDMEMLHRFYFPEVAKSGLNDDVKHLLIEDIEQDFKTALEGIRQLPNRSRLAVLIAYYYYRILLKKIRRTPTQKILQTRIRVSNPKKILLLLKAMFVYKFRLV